MTTSQAQQNTAPKQGELLKDTSELIAIFKKEVTGKQTKLDWFRSLTQDNCFSNYKNLAVDVVALQNAEVTRVFYNYINNLNSDIKSGIIKLPCMPHGGKFNIKAINSTKYAGTDKTKINEIDLNQLAVTEYKENSKDALAILEKEQTKLDDKKKQTVITHDDSAKASYNAVIGLIANLTASDRLNVFDELLSQYEIMLNDTQGKKKKAHWSSQVKAEKAKKEADEAKLNK